MKPLVACIAFASSVVAAQTLPDVPFPPPLPGAKLIATKQINEPLELKQAAADQEAVIAGQSYVQQTYDRPNRITAIVFLQSYRDALFAAGWKFIDVTKLDDVAVQPETVNVAAHYRDNGRNVYVRLTRDPDGPYRINIADVGAEDWAAALANACRVRLYSIHFEHDRPIIKEVESEPTLLKLADLIKSKNTPPVASKATWTTSANPPRRHEKHCRSAGPEWWRRG